MKSKLLEEFVFAWGGSVQINVQTNFGCPHQSHACWIFEKMDQQFSAKLKIQELLEKATKPETLGKKIVANTDNVIKPYEKEFECLSCQ